ncbi:ribosome hibernation-promoting factor, HPF/YfiA family [Myxococcota bacterium]
MKLIVKARHMNLTPALKAHAELKLGDAIKKIFDKPAAKLEVELSELGRTKDGLDKECRVTVFMPRGKTIVISEVSDDMYKAIDLVRDRLMHQVKRQRAKKRVTARGRKEAGKKRAATARKSLTSRA